MPDARIAMPGDTDLDCHLTGLRLAEIVAVPGGDYDTEVTITYDTGGAAGFWTNAATGQRVFPDRVTSMWTSFGLSMQPGHEALLEAMVARLEAWQRDKATLALTAAPGRWTLLSCPGHPAGSQVVLPRGGLRPGVREGEQPVTDEGKADG